MKYLAQTAKTHAIAGASAGVALGLIEGVIAVHQGRSRDRYDIAAETLTHIGTGAVLGALAGATAALAGLSAAGMGGRAVATTTASLVASIAATSVAHSPVERVVRSWSEGVVSGVRSLTMVPDSQRPKPEGPAS